MKFLVDADLPPSLCAVLARHGRRGAAPVQEAKRFLANGLTNNAADNGELLPLIEAVKNNLGELPKRVLADSGIVLSELLRRWNHKGWKLWWPWGAKVKIQRPLIGSIIRPVRGWPSGWPHQRAKRTIGGEK